MSELRSVLERLANRATAAGDGFERLELRRRRRNRNRRAMTVVVALTVAVGGSVGAFAAFRHPGPGTVVGASTEFHALWPERTQAAANLVQSKVDAGDPSLQWRLDDVSTAEHFATYGLGWQQVQEGVIQPGDSNSNGVLIKVTGSIVPSDCRPGGLTAVCPPGSSPGPPERAGAFLLQQLVHQGESGIWSVVSVSGLIPLQTQVGEHVTSGQEISIPFPLPGELAGSVQVGAGYTYVGQCSAVTTLSPVHESDGTITFHVGGAGFEENCGSSSATAGGSATTSDSAELTEPVDGYIFVELVPTGQEPADPVTQRFAAEVISFSAVAVRFVPSSTGSPEAVPGVAQITCDADTTKILTPAVAAQPDGVHIRVDNASGRDLDLAFKGIGGTGVEAGTSTVVWDLRPGTVGVRCLQKTADPDAAAGYLPLRVEDPSKLWVSPDLECAGASQVGGGGSFPKGATGEKGDPVDIVRRTTNGLLASDVVEYAGYPKADERQVRVVRDSSTIAVFHFMPDGQGGWLEDSYQACGDAGLSFGSGSG
jgi:hypothetical protein